GFHVTGVQTCALPIFRSHPTDWKTRSGYMGPMRFPEFTPHLDGAGVIDAVGEEVDQSRVGQRVWVYGAVMGRPTGTAAEYTIVRSEERRVGEECDARR